MCLQVKYTAEPRGALPDVALIPQLILPIGYRPHKQSLAIRMDARTRRVTAPPATTQSDYRRRGSPAARAEELGCLINDDYWSLSPARPACGPGRDRPELGRPHPHRGGRQAKEQFARRMQDIESDTGYDTRWRASDGAISRLSQTTVYDTCGSATPASQRRTAPSPGRMRRGVTSYLIGGPSNGRQIRRGWNGLTSRTRVVDPLAR